MKHKASVAPLVALMMIGLMMASPGHALDAGGGDSSVKVVGIHAVENTDPAFSMSPLLEYGSSKGSCKGVPVVSVACTAVAVGDAEACAEISGTAAGFVPVNGEACFKAGGAAFAAGTGSGYEESREGLAEARAYPAPRQVKDEKVCETDTYGEGTEAESTLRRCYWTYKEVQDPPEIDTKACAEVNLWLEEYQENLTQNPTDPAGYAPLWHANVCAGAAIVLGVFDCLEVEASADAQADIVAEEDDKDGDGDCGAGSAGATASEAEAGLLDTELEVTTQAGTTPALPIAPPGQKWVVVAKSTLDSASQLQVVQTARQSATAAFTASLDQAREQVAVYVDPNPDCPTTCPHGWTPDNGPHDASTLDSFNLLEASFLDALDARLQEDFNVRVLVHDQVA